MCDKCFHSEFHSFPTEKNYLDFDLVLTKKLANEKTIKHKRFVKTGEVQIDTRDAEHIGYNVYECLNCGQHWALRDPDLADRGYFKKVTMQQIATDTKALKIDKKYPWLLSAIIMLILVTIFYFIK
ncbi:MAG: hypothetical protein EOO07_24845 [Chitinophagaceae bacterium]|nr:MAG: hypothetical protein EOO07_24845 [Chitinophagaceae bacterium]